MSQYDTAALYEFLTNTPEQGLRKILVDGKTFTDTHFQLLIKVVRGSKEATEFGTFFDTATYPKLKYGPAETKIKEKFWTDCTQVLTVRGLLSPATKAA